jgi:hypothetical protein
MYPFIMVALATIIFCVAAALAPLFARIFGIPAEDAGIAIAIVLAIIIAIIRGVK